MCDLKTKFKQWEEWCFGGDVNSIKHQIHRMIWDSAVFQCINECRRYASIDDEGQPNLNATLHAFINRCFFQTQAIAIRRLLDKRSDVVSLRGLIDDIRQNCNLLTRAGLLAAHGYPYDYEDERTRLHQASAKNNTQDISQGLINCDHSETMHGFMDALAGVNLSERDSTDVVREKVFEWLKVRLENICQEVCDYVNKFIAHSATPESRAQISADEIKVTLGKILETHEVICETAAFVGMKILYRSYGNFLAIPQYNQFEHFEKPWATEETVKRLHKLWRDYDEATRKWIDWAWQVEFNEKN